MSREHILSKGILELIQATHDIGVSGTAWLPEGQEKRLSPSSLLSNVLCIKHNGDLSVFDAEALKLFKFVKDTYDGPSDSWQEPNQIVIDGLKFQLWSLKVLCGKLASKQFVDDGHKSISTKIPDEWLDLLFRSSPWPKNTGLCVDPNLVCEYDTREFSQGTLLRDETDQILGFRLGVFGLSMTLCTKEAMYFKSPGALLFPRGIEMQKDGRSRKIHFHWVPEPNHRQGLRVRMAERTAR